VKWFYKIFQWSIIQIACTQAARQHGIDANILPGKKPPVYSWSVSDTSNSKTKNRFAAQHKAVLYPVSQASDTALLTLTDAANNFTKT